MAGVAIPKPEKTTGLSTRGAVWAGVGIVVVLGLALLFLLFVMPVLTVRSVVKGSIDGSVRSRDGVRRLGGEERAIERLRRYIHLPRWIAPEQAAAVDIVTSINYGRPAVPFLVEALESPDPEARWMAAARLGELGPAAQEAVPALVCALDDPDNTVRMYVIGALYRIGPSAKSAVPALIRGLAADREIDRSGCAGALGMIGPDARAAVPLIAEMLEEEKDPNTRTCAAKALGRIGPAARDAVSALERVLADNEVRSYVRIAAARALWRITGDAEKAVPVLVSVLEGDKGNWVAALALAEIGPAAAAAVPAVEKVAGQEDSFTVGVALEALWKITGEAERVVPRLRRRFGESKAFPDRLARVLGEIGPPAAAALPELRKLLNRKHPTNHVAAAKAIFRITGDLKDLIQMLGDSKSSLRRGAAKALGRIGPEAAAAIPALELMQHDEKSWIRWAATEALEKIREE